MLISRQRFEVYTWTSALLSVTCGVLTCAEHFVLYVQDEFSYMCRIETSLTISDVEQGARE